MAEIPIDSADPGIDAAFWAELTGWQALGQRPTELRHPSGRGPLLSFWPEPEPKAAKNALHLDLRLEVEDDPAAVLARIEELGGRRVDPGWGELAWMVLADPSGNEFCLLPSRSGLSPGADVVAT